MSTADEQPEELPEVYRRLLAGTPGCRPAAWQILRGGESLLWPGYHALGRLLRKEPGQRVVLELTQNLGAIVEIREGGILRDWQKDMQGRKMTLNLLVGGTETRPIEYEYTSERVRVSLHDVLAGDHKGGHEVSIDFESEGEVVAGGYLPAPGGDPARFDGGFQGLREGKVTFWVAPHVPGRSVGIRFEIDGESKLCFSSAEPWKEGMQLAEAPLGELAGGRWHCLSGYIPVGEARVPLKRLPLWFAQVGGTVALLAAVPAQKGKTSFVTFVAADGRQVEALVRATHRGKALHTGAPTGADHPDLRFLGDRNTVVLGEAVRLEELTISVSAGSVEFPAFSFPAK